MTLDEAIEILTQHDYTVELNEDFGIGVGAPCGLDQGIPHGGDCKGCVPQPIGLLYQRSPHSINPLYAGVPAAHHPEYWLNQVPKKKKKKKKKRKLTEAVISSVIDQFKNLAWTLYKKLLMKQDLSLYNSTESDLYNDFDTGFKSDEHNNTRTAEAGHFLNLILKNLLREYSIIDDDKNELKSLYKKYLNIFKTEINRPGYKNDECWINTI